MSKDERKFLEGDLDTIKWHSQLLADLWGAKLRNHNDDIIKAMANGVESEVKVLIYEMPIMGNPETGQPIAKMMVKLDNRENRKSTIEIKNGAAALLSWEAKTKSLCSACNHYRTILGDPVCTKTAHPTKFKKTCNAYSPRN